MLKQETYVFRILFANFQIIFKMMKFDTHMSLRPHQKMKLTYTSKKHYNRPVFF